MSRRRYVRIKFRPAGKKPRWYWAIKLAPGRYKRTRKDGDVCIAEKVRKDGVTVCTEELLIGEPIEERPARMNTKYAWLEENGDD
jgi:hypothetical protein